MTALRDMHRQTRERYIANNRIIERYVRHCVFLRDLSFNRAQPMLRCRIVRSVDDASGPLRIARCRTGPRMQRRLCRAAARDPPTLQLHHRAYADAVRLAMPPVWLHSAALACIAQHPNRRATSVSAAPSPSHARLHIAMMMALASPGDLQRPITRLNGGKASMMRLP